MATLHNSLLKFKSYIWRPLCQEFYDLKSRLAVKAVGIFIFDDRGNKIVDLNSSWWVSGIGHLNKKIIKAVKKQLSACDSVVLADFLHEPALRLTEALQKLLNLNINLSKTQFKNITFEKFFFADNGSTAVEIAIKIAHQFYVNRGIFGKNKIIAFSGSYHGETFGAMSVGAESEYFEPFKRLFFDVLFLDFPATFVGDEEHELEKREINVCLALRSLLTSRCNEISSIIFEPIVQGAAGMHIVRLSFLQKILAICREFDILVIFDEVMTGFGRTGEMFAFEKILKHSECQLEDASPFSSQRDFSSKFFCVPDIIALSKVITNGLFPFGVTACNDRVYRPFYSADKSKTFLHSHSHTGNPVICASALANLNVLQEEKILKKIKQIEVFLFQFANDLHLKYRTNGDRLIEKIRFCGTILAFDVNQDAFFKIKNRPFDGSEFKEFLLANKCLYIRPIKNSIFVIPPYIITVKQLHMYLNVIIESLYLM